MKWFQGISQGLFQGSSIPGKIQKNPHYESNEKVKILVNFICIFKPGSAMFQNS